VNQTSSEHKIEIVNGVVTVTSLQPSIATPPPKDDKDNTNHPVGKQPVGMVFQITIIPIIHMQLTTDELHARLQALFANNGSQSELPSSPKNISSPSTRRIDTQPPLATNDTTNQIVSVRRSLPVFNWYEPTEAGVNAANVS
jgi:hypothetical protein